MRIFYHAINGIGLGHLMRLSAISAAVYEKAPHVHQFVATTANYPPHFRRMNVPVMVLPSDDTGAFFTPRRRHRSVSAAFGGAMLNHAIAEYDPRVVVFDTHPPARLVRKVNESGRQAVLVYRRCREEYLLKQLRQGFFERFRLLLIPHDREEFEAGLRRGTVRALQGLEGLRYAGPVVYPGLAGPEAVAGVESRYGLEPDSELIVVTGGAGGLARLHGVYFERACEAALRLREKRPGLRIVCVGGPYSGGVTVPQGCDYAPDEPNLQALIARSGLVVTIPGYNTVQELLHTGSRGLLVPMSRKMEDIESRVSWLEKQGRVRCIQPSAPVALYAQRMEELLAAPRPAPTPCRGAFAAADEILEAARAPRRYVCGVEANLTQGVTVTRSARKLARTLVENSEDEALVRIDWNLVGPVFTEMGEAEYSIAGLEVVVGPGPVEEAGERIRTVHDQLRQLKFPLGSVVFCVDDPSAGRALAELIPFVRDLKFKALVARFPADVLEQIPEEVFENLEACRGVGASFRIDIALLEDGFVFVDQP